MEFAWPLSRFSNAARNASSFFVAGERPDFLERFHGQRFFGRLHLAQRHLKQFLVVLAGLPSQSLVGGKGLLALPALELRTPQQEPQVRVAR